MTRRGTALLSALLVVLLAAVLASMSLNAAQLRWLGGTRLIAAGQASSAASGAVDQRRATWDVTAFESLAIGRLVAGGAVMLPGGVRVTDSLMRLGPALFLLRAIGERVTPDGSLLARDAVVELVQLRPPTLIDTTAVVAAGPIAVSGAAAIVGDDHIPAGWDTLCTAPAAATVPWLVDPSPFARLTPIGVMDLVGWRDLEFTGTVTGPVPVVTPGQACDLVASMNWGDPAGGPCGGYLPLIVLQPGGHVADGTGQGLILALGDVELSGNFYFAGAILALGGVRMSGRSRLVGTLLAGGSVQLTEQGRVERSGCAVRRALAAQQRLAGPASKGWWRWP